MAGAAKGTDHGIRLQFAILNVSRHSFPIRDCRESHGVVPLNQNLHCPQLSDDRPTVFDARSSTVLFAGQKPNDGPNRHQHGDDTNYERYHGCSQPSCKAKHQPNGQE